MPLPDPQTIECYRDTDTEVIVRMEPAEDVSGMTVRMRVVDDAGTVMTEQTTGAGITLVTATPGVANSGWRFVLSPDLVGMTVGSIYTWWFRCTDTGARGVFATGPMPVAQAGG